MYNRLITAITVILLSSALYADTILLKDGTYFVGKIIQWDAYHILFKNAHGVFTIRKSQLVKMYITENLHEDIELKAVLGHNISTENIITHYNSGSKGVPIGGINRSELESGMNQYELGARINLSGTYYHTIGDLAEELPSGLGISLGYTQSLVRILSDEAAFKAPSVYIESEFALFSRGSAEVKSLTLFAGPKWDFNFPGGRWGKTEFHAMPGASYLMIKDEGYNNRNQTISLKSSAGYEFHAGRFAASLNFSYLYMFDKLSPLQSAGITFSAAYKY
jgi:hypothetical protein